MPLARRRVASSSPWTAWNAGRASCRPCRKFERDYGIPVVSVASLDDLMAFLRDRPDFKASEAAVARYRQEYGVARDR